MKKSERKLSNQKQYITLAVGLLMAGLLVIFMCAQMLGQISDVTRKETSRYLKEISENTSMTIDARMEMTFQILSSIGETYIAMPEKSELEVNDYLERKAQNYKFSWMSIILSDGTAFCTGNHTAHEAALRPCVTEAMGSEKNSVVRIRPTANDNHDGIIYTVPLYQNNKIIGVISAWNDVEPIREALSIDTLDGAGFSLIIEKSGDYLVSSSNKSAMTQATNFFDLLDESGTIEGGYTLNEMRNIMQHGEIGSMEYTLADGNTKLMYFHPLDYDNLYLLSIVPLKAASQSTDRMIHRSIMIVIVVVLLFFGLLLYIFFSSVQNQNKISRLAFQDSVTGGVSKLWFDMEAERLIRSAPPNTYRFVAFNIQKFKLINDNFGKEAGDKVLQHVYNTIEGLLEEGEIITRSSADDFYILKKAKTKREQEQDFRFYSEKINEYNLAPNQKYFINISLGVVLVDDPYLPLVQIQDRANIARKSAKHTYDKRFSLVFYTDLERMQLLKEKEMENRMEDALQNGEFILYLQPKIELEHNKVKGAEALVRWQTREGVLIMPNDFIPFFEKNGFIIKLDLYVFEKACALIRNWIDNGVEPVPISVNMSRAHLRNPGYLEYYQEIAQRYSVPRRLLEIELTESLVFENLEELIDVIDCIHKAGFMCSLDDFGSGYSSLSTLTNIKVDALKLDKAFWNSGCEEKRSHDVIAMVVELGKRLNMTTISEGVETVSQLEFLREIRCDLAQGYVFSKPVPTAEFELLAYGKTVSESVNISNDTI